MHKIGAFEAKTHFSALLERVSRGEHIVITKHEVPVAGVDRERRKRAIARLKEFSQGQTLNGLSVRALREEGRR
jgi:prevent-host-death family protein